MRRAQVPAGVLVGLLVLLIISILLFSFVGKTKTAVQKGGNLEVCRNSFLSAYAGEVATSGVYQPTFTCPAKHLEISDANLDAMAAQVAQQFKDCWYKTGGNDNRIGYVDVPWLPFDKWANFCLTCSTFSVNRPLPVQRIVNFMDRPVPGSQDKWYQRYLNMPVLESNPPGWRWLVIAPLDDDAKPPVETITAGPLSRSWRYRFIETLVPGKQYYVVSINYGFLPFTVEGQEYPRGEYNIVVVTERDSLPKLDCTVLHYETA